MHPFRPQITFTKVREIWSFSIWSLVRGSIGNSTSICRVDKVAIGGLAVRVGKMGLLRSGRADLAM